MYRFSISDFSKNIENFQKLFKIKNVPPIMFTWFKYELLTPSIVFFSGELRELRELGKIARCTGSRRDHKGILKFLKILDLKRLPKAAEEKTMEILKTLCFEIF